MLCKPKVSFSCKLIFWSNILFHVTRCYLCSFFLALWLVNNKTCMAFGMKIHFPLSAYFTAAPMNLEYILLKHDRNEQSALKNNHSFLSFPLISRWICAKKKACSGKWIFMFLVFFGGCCIFFGIIFNSPSRLLSTFAAAAYSTTHSHRWQTLCSKPAQLAWGSVWVLCKIHANLHSYNKFSTILRGRRRKENGAINKIIYHFLLSDSREFSKSIMRMCEFFAG